MNKPELMAPAGDWTKLRAAVENGADAVYLGLQSLNMRATANNFRNEELSEVTKYCHENNVKVYLTMNNIIFNHQLDEMRKLLKIAKEAKIDMVICWDHAVIREALKQQINICVSTQASISNVEAAKFYRDLGCKRVVLARECTLEQIREIKNELKDTLEIEIFIHGAMCVSLSGRCFMSHHLYGKNGDPSTNSANCGQCLQPCRREYMIYDPQDDYKLMIGRGYVMSAKDLCTIEFIDKILELGIESLKIEGRKRSPEYVAMATSVYREAIDLYYENPKLLTTNILTAWKTDLEKVFNRGFNSGFFYEYPAGKNSVTDEYGSKASESKEFVGIIDNYYDKPKVALAKLQSLDIKVGDNLMIQGPTTGVIRFSVEELRDDNKKIIQEAKKGSICTFKVSKVRKNDKIFLIKNKNN